jgi:ATP-dependent exoDNAse (exonuclease V) beta subunit
VLEEISNGTLTVDRQPLTAEISRLLRLAGLPDSLSSSVESTVHGLESNVGLWVIIKPQPNSYAELPIMYSDGETVHTGRIDRVIVAGDEVRIYDYKTFGVAKKDIPVLAQEYYDGQLRFYEEALRKLYPSKKIFSFLIFTALPLIVPGGK